jgi:hypothetical protein
VTFAGPGDATLKINEMLVQTSVGHNLAGLWYANDGPIKPGIQHRAALQGQN